jgi:regulatory protein
MNARHTRRGDRDNVDPHGDVRLHGDPGTQDPEQHAREVCLRLLTARSRTRAELATALERRGVDGQVADRVLSRLEEAGLIDDAAFAQSLVQSRHSRDGLARKGLTAELRRKGVAEPLAAEAVSVVDEEAEEERARQLVRRRLSSSGGVNAAAQVRRLVGMLARRGYSTGLAVRVVREELRRAGDDTDVLDENALADDDLDGSTT